MNWMTNTKAKIQAEINQERAIFHFLENAENAYVEVEYSLPFQTDGREYVFFPSCCYDGNRFDVLKKDYPPLFTEKEARVDMPVTITDVPRLEKDGSGVIEVTTGDVSVPCIGVYSAAECRAVFLFTIQQIGGINLGLAYENGKLRVNYPHMRKEKMYIWPHMVKSTDKGTVFEAGSDIEIPYRIIDCPCHSMEEFYHVFFMNRKCMNLDHERYQPIAAEKQFEIQKNKMNQLNWKEDGQFYAVETSDEGNCVWQPGWVGGGMYTYPLMKLGGTLEWERSIKTLEHVFKGQTEAGFVYESGDAKGNFCLGIFNYKDSENWHMVRKSADILYYLFKHLKLIKERGETVPESIENGGRKMADAFVKLWKSYGQYGQFVDLFTGELLVGGSESGCIVPGALAEAAEYYDNREYLETALESAEFYCKRVMQRGYTTGGPGEILQCPDSESAFALLESVVTLYGFTKEKKWLDYGRFLAEFCSSWVVAYNYVFPECSEFYKLGMKTTGCVFANAQNKHAAPGICTFSGYSLYRLYQWTGETAYLELYEDITKTVSQYMSTEERPIHSWDVPKDAMLQKEGEVLTVEPRMLLPGFICERVNMSDWESERCIGGVFPSSCCWCETANLLILAECENICEEKRDARADQ